MISGNQNLQLLTDKYKEEVRNDGILEVSINQYKDGVVFRYANNEERFKRLCRLKYMPMPSSLYSNST